MKPEEQRIAIAKACGWKPCTKGCEGKTWRYPDDSGCTPDLPNYLNDLNAMHEAEKVLTTTDQQNTYHANIAELTWGCEETGNRQVVFNQLTATASQRAEAFLKTLNLWKP